MRYLSIILSLIILILLSCSNSGEQSKNNFVELTEEQKKYWYNGEAEITSFALTQARYGELRTGNAVMIFVTEDFSTKEFTKTDLKNESTTSVLKLNFTKNFITGIYPYSIMTSSFVPFKDNERALKVSTSVQEWCGHVYTELIRKKNFEVNIFSYFEGESKESIKIPITFLEDEIWSIIRLRPKDLPLGKQKLIPSFSFLRLMHIEVKAYDCEISLKEISPNLSELKLSYSELERTLSITFENKFPHQIIKWEEEYYDGLGANKQKLKTTGELIKTIRSAYWTKNTNADSLLRKELRLD